MPKCQLIEPTGVRAAQFIEFSPIPVNQYRGTLIDELASGNLSREDAARIHRDMVLIRAFESALEAVKKWGNYRDIKYDHRGPAHLSIGQEAVAVGQAFMLDIHDHIFGSHRSHGEILAKGLSIIAKLGDDALLEIMRNHFDGACLRIVEQNSNVSVQHLAIDFLVFGTLAEIFGREPGFNRGLGGSMHAFFTPFGVYPNNAIVGGSADIAVGAALYKHIHRRPGITIANIGDAAAGCGPTWEALCFATMDQFQELWDADHRGGLPLIINFVNNFYGMGGQPVGETMGFKVLARLGAGLTPSQLHAERVDGFNPLAVIDAVRRKKAVIENKQGPVLLDTITYRFSGHSPSDASSYREKAEVDAWRGVDPVERFGDALIDAGICTTDDVQGVWKWCEDVVQRAFRLAVDTDISPRAKLEGTGCLLDHVMFSHSQIATNGSLKPEVLIPRHENSRVRQLAKRSRSGFDRQGTALPKQQCITIRDSLFEAIIDRFYNDPLLIAYGEENRDWGGAFGVYRGLTESLPYHRLFNSPISEAAIIGTAVGYALEGGRALIELMYCDFLGRAGDEVFNQLAKWQSMSGGLLRMPVVVRVSVGSKYGAQHSQDWTSLCAHIPGLKVVFPATPFDAKGLMYSALLGTDPVIFFESQRIYDMPELFRLEGVPEGPYQIAIGEPDIKRSGNDLTILSIGATLYRAIQAADILEQQYGVLCEVIDARSLVPFDYALLLESVRKTRRLVLTSDACERGSVLHTVASKVTQFAFDDLDAPPVVVGARNWITPADEVEDCFFPQPHDIIDAVHQYLVPLPDYRLRRNCTTEEMLRRSRLGV